jgi:hypothetical protein
VCEASSIAESLRLVHEAREFADELLDDLLRVPLAKALDVGSARGFDRAVALFAGWLRRAAGSSDLDAVRSAVRVLDIDWAGTTAERRGRLIAEALRAAGRQTAIVPERIQAPLGDAAEAVVAASRRHARREQGLSIRAAFNAVDRRVIRHVVTSQGNFVRDEYGRRLDTFGERARLVVARGLEAGLGRSELAAELEAAAQQALVGRAPFYWEVVAGSFVARARAFGLVSSYAEAGIQRYVIEAVLDEATTPVCRFLHGQTFSVGAALQRFERVEKLEDPEHIKRELPWVRQSIDPESGSSVLYVNRGDGRLDIAEVVRSGVGRREDRGEFRALLPDARLQELGLGFPPYHGLCRTTTLAVV